MIDKNHIKKLSKVEKEIYFDKEKNRRKKNLNKAIESKKTSFLYGLLFVSCGLVGFINPDNAVICLILISSSSIPFILSRSFKKDEKEAKKELNELLEYEKELYEEDKREQEIVKEKISVLDKSKEEIKKKEIVSYKRQEPLFLEPEDIKTCEEPYQMKRSIRIDKDK